MPIPIVEPSVRETTRRIRRRVQSLEGVKECVNVGMSFSRKKPHIHVHVLLKGQPDYDGIHKVSATIDHEVRKIVPNARVSIRSEPGDAGGEAGRVWELVRRIAEDEPGSRGAHNIHVQNLGGRLCVDFHLEVAARMSVAQAHEVATDVAKRIKAASPTISEVVIHEETVSDLTSNERSGHGADLRWFIEHTAARFPEIKLASPPIIKRLGNHQLHVIIRAAFSADLGVETAAIIASRLEVAIRQGFPAILRVDITEEPVDSKRNVPSTKTALA